MYPTLTTVHTRQRSDRSILLTPLFKCGYSLGSDNHKGMYLDSRKLHRAPSLMSSQSRWMAVHQHRPPSEKQWILWRNANTLWSTEDGMLRQPLCNWLRDLPTSRISHFVYRYEDTLFLLTQFGYLKRTLRCHHPFRGTG